MNPQIKKERLDPRVDFLVKLGLDLAFEFKDDKVKFPLMIQLIDSSKQIVEEPEGTLTKPIEKINSVRSIRGFLTDVVGEKYLQKMLDQLLYLRRLKTSDDGRNHVKLMNILTTMGEVISGQIENEESPEDILSAAHIGLIWLMQADLR